MAKPNAINLPFLGMVYTTGVWPFFLAFFFWMIYRAYHGRFHLLDRSVPAVPLVLEAALMAAAQAAGIGLDLENPAGKWLKNGWYQWTCKFADDFSRKTIHILKKI